MNVVGVRGGEAPVCTACDSHTRERTGCGRSVLRHENPPILPLLFAKKFAFLRHFLTRRWRSELRSGPFRPTLVPMRSSVTELAAETRVSSKNPEPSSEWQFRVWWVIANVKKKVSKKVSFLDPAPAGRASAEQENQEISKNLTSAELGSGSAELGSAPLSSSRARLSSAQLRPSSKSSGNPMKFY